MPDAEIKPDALAKRTEPVEEIIPDGLGGERAITRASDGKFQRRITSAVQKSMKDSVKFLEGTDEGGIVRADAIRQSVYENILAAGTKNLMGQVKGAAFLEASAFGKAKDVLVENKNDNTIKIVILTQPEGIATAEPRALQPTQPTFADATFSTNPAPSASEAWKAQVDAERGLKPEPAKADNSVGNKVADAIAAKQQRFDRTKARY